MIEWRRRPTTVCWVALPLRPIGVHPDRWSLGELPFAVASGRSDHPLLREGRARPADLPLSDQLVLVFPAADVTQVPCESPGWATLPPSRWREALPHLMEGRLASPVEACHFAVGPAAAEGSMRPIACIDRAWMGFVLRCFQEAGRPPQGAYSAAMLLPENSAARLSAHRADLDPSGPQTVWTWRGNGWQGGGLQFEASPQSLVPAWGSLAVLPEGAAGLTVWARAGVRPAFNLCQFEWAPALLERGGRQGLAWARLGGYALVLMILYLAGQLAWWGELAWQHRRLVSQERSWLAARGQVLETDDDVIQAARQRVHDSVASSPGQDSELAREAGRWATVLEAVPGVTVDQADYRVGHFEVRLQPGYDPAALGRAARQNHWALREVTPGHQSLEAEP